MPLIIRYLLMLAVLSIFASDIANAGDKIITGHSILKFSLGVISAFAIHEGSHALAAEVSDIELDWEAGSYNQPLAFIEYGTSGSKGVALYSAGLISQVLGSEIILQTDRIEKNNAFVRGMMAWNILNPILYSLDYWIIRRSNRENADFHQGDLEGIEHYSSGSTANGFALAMAGISAIQGYRFLKTQTWAPEWLKSNSINVQFGPVPSGLMALKVEWRF